MNRFLAQLYRDILMLAAGAAIFTLLLVIAQLILYRHINW